MGETVDLPLDQPNPRFGANVVLRFTPYRTPLAYDPRVASRWPDSWKATLRPGYRDRFFRLTWGRPRWFPLGGRGVDLDLALANASERALPATDAERVEWFEPFRCFAIDVEGSPLAWEIVRAPLESIGTGILESIATYLRAQPLDAQGEPTGAAFRTVTDTDPCAFPIAHPDPNVQPLRVTWRLVADGLPENTDGTRRPGMLVGAPPAAIPSMGEPIYGLPSAWSDLRFSWGSRYTQNLRHVVFAGPVMLRLFAVVSAAPGRWDVHLGGLLGGYWQSAGHRGAALRSAIRRW